MRKFKRKRKFTWFPIRGSEGPEGTNDDFSSLVGSFFVTPDGSSTVTISPLIPDVPMEGDTIDQNAPGQLVQALGQEYYVERIVGKCHLAATGPVDDVPSAEAPKTIQIGCGIFVARANDEDVGGGFNTPIGSATLAERQENYSPLGVDAIREPWMWRRSWVLSTGRPSNVPQAQGVPFGITHTVIPNVGPIVHPGTTSNNQMGSALDGPHFDIKSVRRVGNDERLWLVVATRALDIILNQRAPNTSLDPANGNGVHMVFDYRVLGRLTRPRNRSAF